MVNTVSTISVKLHEYIYVQQGVALAGGVTCVNKYR